MALLVPDELDPADLREVADAAQELALGQVAFVDSHRRS
jgi:hypothetical protein